MSKSLAQAAIAPEIDSPAVPTHSEAFAHALAAIASQPIETEPFPHIYIADVFPAAYYRWLLQRIADVGSFVPTLYPGVAVDLDARTFRDYGLTCANFASDPELSHLHRFLRSDGFARLLLDKFSAPNSWGARGSAIPLEKHVFFKNGEDAFASVLDLHKDLPGYEISPHPDVPSKIVTFLFYLTPTDDLSRFGTFLCKVKPGREAALARASRSAVSTAFLRVAARLIGKNYGFGQRDEWYPWEAFEIVKTAAARPNSLLVFAPNSQSYHAVRMDIPPDNPLQERQTIRGFIRTGKNTGNYVSGYAHGVPRRMLFRAARWLRPRGKKEA